MLKISVPPREIYLEETNEFITIKGQTLQLEHSLISLSKWESTWCKPYMSKNEKTREEIIDYVRCMTLTPNVKPEVYYCLTDDNIKQISDYIEAPMTATTFSDNKNGPGSREVITAEIIYYWMIANNIPWECQKWHLNRLITLIRVCSIKNTPAKKMSRSELMNRNAALNAARRNKLNSKG